MNFCKRCVYPEYAVNLDVSDDGICSSCKVFEEINNISDEEWKLRENKLIQIIEKQKKNNKSYYDCLIPVGGGKDSYWQVHKIKELGFNPLLVTYHGNNYYPEGQKNLDRMREVFNCDHYIFYPGVETLIKLNRAGFKKMGDMKDLVGMIPGASKMMKESGEQVDNESFKPIEAIINSMTKKERSKPEIINGSRRKRIATGSGRTVQEVNTLIKQFNQMKIMIKKMKNKKNMNLPFNFG